MYVVCTSVLLLQEKTQKCPTETLYFINVEISNLCHTLCSVGPWLARSEIPATEILWDDLYRTWSFIIRLAKFLVSDWVIQPALAWGCRTGPPAYVAWWRASKTTLCQSRLYHPVTDYEFGLVFCCFSSKSLAVKKLPKVVFLLRDSPSKGDQAYFWWAQAWARTYKCLCSPGIDSKEWVPPAYVAWRAGTITLFLLGSFPSPHRLFKNSSSDFPEKAMSGGGGMGGHGGGGGVGSF